MALSVRSDTRNQSEYVAGFRAAQLKQRAISYIHIPNGAQLEPGHAPLNFKGRMRSSAFHAAWL